VFHVLMLKCFLAPHNRYIMGVAAMSSSPPDLDSARYHLEQAQEMMEKLMEETQQVR
jgi:hypothetical protein